MDAPCTVSRLGAAIAVLSPGVPADGATHTDAATRMLRAATGLSDLIVSRRPSGRPRLAPPYPELGVSLSYRDGLLLVGFDPTAGVGVDIEPAARATGLDAARLAGDHFAAAEARAVHDAGAEAARDLCLRLWVAKEAILKLTGRGVYDGLAEPDLSPCLAALLAGEDIALAASAGSPACAVVVVRPVVPGLDDAPYCALARTGAGQP